MEQQPATTPARADARRRNFSDSQGLAWEVREAKNHDYDRRGGYSLIFESINVVRRVRAYPPDWFDLPADALRAMNDGT